MIVLRFWSHREDARIRLAENALQIPGYLVGRNKEGHVGRILGGAGIAMRKSIREKMRLES